MGAAQTTAETKQTLLECLERFDVAKLSAADRRIFRENARRFMNYLDTLAGKTRKQTATAAAIAALTDEEEADGDPA